MAVDASIVREAQSAWEALFAAAAANEATTRWASSRALWERPELLLEEREGKPATSRAVKRRPSDERLWQFVEYAYDESGEIVTATRRAGVRNPKVTSRCARTAIAGLEVVLTVWHEAESPRLSRVAVAVRDASGCLVGVDSRVIGPARSMDIEERYRYSEGQVTQIETRHVRNDAVTVAEANVTYDADGTLSAIDTTVLRNGAPVRRVAEYRRPTAQASASIKSEVVAAMARDVIDWSHRVAPDRNITAIGLLYSMDDSTVAPALGLLSEADRKRLAGVDRDGGEPARVWNPAEWSILDATPDEFSADSRLVDMLGSLHASWPEAEAATQRRVLLLDVAKCVAEQLQRVSGDGDSAPLVFAMDAELEDLTANLHGVASADERAAFAKP